MFFILSKTVAFLALPSNLLIVLGLAGLLLLRTRWRRAGQRLAVTSLVLLALIGFLPFGNLLAVSLEQRFPPWDAARGAPDGIIVLGGAISPDLSAERGETVLGSSAERITVVGKLARLYPNARIVFTGGNASIIPGGRSEADFVLPVFESFNIARERVQLERLSRNTAENAVFTKQLVQPKPGERWLLVTSAQHMPRAVGCFRHVGFPVEAYPVDWRTGGWKNLLRPAFTLSGGLGRTDRAVREWIGLLVYRLTGRTGEFFPGPDGKN